MSDDVPQIGETLYARDVIEDGDEAERRKGSGKPGVLAEELEVGDRVDLCLHGATSTNHAKGTVVKTGSPTIVANGIVVELDKKHRNCDKRYETTVGSINRIIGDER